MWLLPFVQTGPYAQSTGPDSTLLRRPSLLALQVPSETGVTPMSYEIDQSTLQILAARVGFNPVSLSSHPLRGLSVWDGIFLYTYSPVWSYCGWYESCLGLGPMRCWVGGAHWVGPLLDLFRPAMRPMKSFCNPALMSFLVLLGSSLLLFLIPQLFIYKGVDAVTGWSG